MSEIIANGLIYLAGILWGIELIPQITKTIKTKNVTGLSKSFFFICISAYIIYMIGNGMLQNYNIIISHIPSLVLLSVQLILVCKYDNKS